jgi:DNA polymerase (family X)
LPISAKKSSFGRLKMELIKAREIAEELKRSLGPACERIEIAGSIRRQKPDVGDIELLIIPKYGGLMGEVNRLDQEIVDLMLGRVLDYRLNKLGRRVYGPKNKLMVHVPSGVGVDIFSTDELCWHVSLVVRTGGKVTNQRIAMAAIKKGWHLQAYGAGFSTPDGDVVCKSERDVFEAVGLPYLPPERRE